MFWCFNRVAINVRLVHIGFVCVEWDVVDVAKFEGENVESGTIEELVGVEWSFHRLRVVWVLVVLACLVGLVGVVVVTHHF